MGGQKDKGAFWGDKIGLYTRDAARSHVKTDFEVYKLKLWTTAYITQVTIRLWSRIRESFVDVSRFMALEISLRNILQAALNTILREITEIRSFTTSWIDFLRHLIEDRTSWLWQEITLPWISSFALSVLVTRATDDKEGELRHEIEGMVSDVVSYVEQELIAIAADLDRIFIDRYQKIIGEVEEDLERKRVGERVYYSKLRYRINSGRRNVITDIKAFLSDRHRSLIDLLNDLEDRIEAIIDRYAEQLEAWVLERAQERGIDWRFLKKIVHNAIEGIKHYAKRRIYRETYKLYKRVDDLYWGIITRINRMSDRILIRIGEWEIRIEDIADAAELAIDPDGTLKERGVWSRIFKSQNLLYAYLAALLGISRTPRVEYNIERDSPFTGIAWALEEIKAANRDEPVDIALNINDELRDLVVNINIPHEEALATWEEMSAERENQGAQEEEDIVTIEADVVKEYPEARPQPFFE